MNRPRIVYETPRVAAQPGETVVTSTCGHKCGGRCAVNAHVRDGQIVKISTDPRRWTPEMPPLHACVRGFGQLERVNHPDRLKHPLRRTGPRGSGQFERISWDEAIDEVARQMLRVRDTYGPAAILTEVEWLRELTGDVIDDFDTFRERGLARLPAPEDAVAFARQIRDPERHPFTTPSGKIEIYSMSLAAKPDPYGLGAIPPIPTWIEDEVDARYPLRLVTPKSRARTHSIHDNQPILSRADSDDVWINTADAAARGIVDGQPARVFNARGATRLPARVTDRIAPGVVSIKEGARFTPDASGADTHGCANVLTADRTSPAGAAPFNSCFVDVAPASP